MNSLVQSPRSKVRNPKRLPFVLVNMAMTADGKIATGNRAVSSFGSRRDHDHLQELRATADAVMAGARTVDSAAVNLGPGPEKYRRARLNTDLAEYNLRIIVSRGGTVNPNAEIFKHRFSPIIILTTDSAPKKSLERLRQLANEVKICGANEIDFVKALQWLREKWNIKRLLCEGGGELNDVLFRANLVNELHLTICPKIFAGREAPTISDGRGFKHLVEAAQLILVSKKAVGDELFLKYSVCGDVQERR